MASLPLVIDPVTGRKSALPGFPELWAITANYSGTAALAGITFGLAAPSAYVPGQRVRIISIHNPAVWMEGVIDTAGDDFLDIFTDLATGGSGTVWYIRPAGVPGVDGATPVASFFIDAAAMVPRVTSGALVGTMDETSTNKINRDALIFTVAAVRYAQAQFAWPVGWAAARASFVWMSTSGTGSVVWQVQARCWADGDASDSAFGSAVTVTDAAASANTLRISAQTGDITPSGSVADGALTTLQIYRDPDHASDDSPVDALLLAIILHPVLS